ncbi:MAG TPA: radical SAM protein [Thermoanaerobaculia bacterium]
MTVRRVSNPPNPWTTTEVEWLGEPPTAELEVYEEEAKRALAENESPDVGFRWSLNPYRGCFHACGYCYARSSHQYLGFGAGTDFDRKIVVKTNIAERLREEFLRPSWKGDVIAFSGNTDCYQPLEAVYGLTRKSLEICREFRNPVGIITKGALVRRDVPLLAAMSRETKVSVTLSIPFADDATGRAVEPGASLPSQRFETLRMLSDAGIETGIGIAPVIPGLNDGHVAPLLQRARAAGARSAFLVLIRLSGQTLLVFEERLAEAFPDRARKIWNAIEEMRGGRRNDTRFHDRMIGRGPRWNAIQTLFELECRRLGLNTGDEDSGDQEDAEGERSPFRRPSPQGELFPGGSG